MKPMNASTCAALLENVTWDAPRLVFFLTVLGIIDVMVIIGNILVIAAVFISSKLRSVTNLFIVSLAVADLMVGVAVLPFSAAWEVYKVWIFGDIWCSIWLATDVWMCTSSILNLCAISLDRYLAVTRPITYPSIMSMKRAKILIGFVWVLSFVICFPPLLGWKDKQSQMVLEDYDYSTNDTFISSGRPLTPGAAPSLNPTFASNRRVLKKCPWICELTSDTGYVVYSALGSFYIPMFVMLFFYWRIYLAAVHTTTAINRGFRTTKGTKAIGSRFDEQRLTLRIHRGRGSVIHHGTTSNSTTATNSGANSVSNSPGKSQERYGRMKKAQHDNVKISVSYPSNETINTLQNLSPSTSPKSGSYSSSPTNTPNSNSNYYSVHYSSETNATSMMRGSPNSGGNNRDCHLRVTGARLASHRRSCRRRSSGSDCGSGTAPSSPTRPRLLGETLSGSLAKDLSPSPTNEDGSISRPKLVSKMGKRNIKAQVKRIRMETKAAKTLGIIVGGFIFCWLPFFTLYLIRAFCPTCIHPFVFSIMFWLGYCNSAINPCIYALFSKDFRFAFKRIICKCFCYKQKGSTKSSPFTRRGSDGSQMGLKKDRTRSPSYNNDYGAAAHLNPASDSEQNNEAGSDSR